MTSHFQFSPRQNLDQLRDWQNERPQMITQQYPVCFHFQHRVFTYHLLFPLFFIRSKTCATRCWPATIRGIHEYLHAHHY